MRILIILMIVISLSTVTVSCKSVNKQRAVEYYDQHVKHFPEEG